MKKLLSMVVCLFMLISFASCSKNGEDMGANMIGDMEMGVANDAIGLIPPGSTISDEDYGKFIENEFVNTSDEPISTFSADVDTASYAYFRKLVSQGYSESELIATAGNSIRTEEMINYFDYSYNEPSESELFGKSVRIADCPWNNDAKLMILGLKAKDAAVKSDNNLVFLIDVSGSMSSSDKLPLLKKSFGYLVDRLDEGDRVSIVTYSGKEKVVLEGCAGNKREKIMNAINSLEAEGSTNGKAGLQKAYALAEEYYISGGNNRIIMASDGDLNVGISTPEELKDYVSQKRDEGVYLSVLGFGTGNYKDASMEAIADNGNGVYYYIDSETEAERIFGKALFSTLYTVAENVKLQLRFNAESVESYRLVGYENRLLNNEDFENDAKDAGEVGAGHSVTVCYELILKEEYAKDAEFAELAVRYVRPGEEKSTEELYSIETSSLVDSPDDEFEFICAVVETSMILHQSRYAEDVRFSDIYAKLMTLDLGGDEYKEQFAELIAKLCNENK